MTGRTRGSLVVIALLATSARASTAEFFYDPDLVITSAQELKIPADKVTQLRREVTEAKIKMADAENQVKKLQLELELLVSDDKTSVEVILGKVDAIEKAETELKRIDMKLALQIRRALTLEQRAILDQKKLQANRPGPENGPRGQPEQGAPRNRR